MNFLERDAAIESLETILKDAQRGRGRIALVSGEAGIGKTTLVEQFTQHWSKTRVLWGTCDSLFTPRPLGPVHDIARQLDGALIQLLDTEANRSTIFSVSLSELQRETAIVVVEDAHWADEATLDWLKYVGRRILSTRALLIITYRDDEIGPQHPLRSVLGDLATSNATYRVKLSPLSVDAVRALVAERALDPITLHRQTNGNPFFVSEVVASEISAIPPTVRDAVLARVSRLSLSARAALEAAAVIGTRIEPWLLAQVTGAEAQATEECLAIGVLIAEDNRFAFRHELGRQTILDSISPQRRLVLHKLVLEALKTSPFVHEDIARLAHLAHGANDADAVLIYAPAAARQASALGAHRQAATHYQAALPYAHLLADEPRGELLEACAVECEWADQMLEAEQAQRAALEIWRTLEQHLKEGHALRRLSEIVLKRHRKLDMERYASEAIAVLEPLGPSRELAMAYSHMSRLHGTSNHFDDTVRWGMKALAMADSLGDAETLAHALCNIGHQDVRCGEPSAGLAKLRRSLQIWLAQGIHNEAGWTYSDLADGLLYRHDYLTCEQYLSEGIAYCTQNDLDFWRVILLGHRAQLKFEQGHWDDAEQDCLAASQLWRKPMEEVIRVQVRLRIRRGSPIPADTLDTLRDLAHTSPLFHFVCDVAAILAEAAWLRGDLTRCRSEAEPMLQIASQRDVPKELGELTYWLWRSAGLTLMPPRVAEPYSFHISGDWRAAAERWAQLGCPYEQAMALMDGDSTAQAAALDIFERLGAQPMIVMMRERLQSLPSRRLAKDKFDGLTEREREVATLIAQGKSNREIAEVMVVGVKTVETYITRILNKLGFDSRVQVATWAVAKGLNSIADSS